MTELAQRIKEHARSLGFDAVGIAPATPADGFEQFQHWLAQGYAGDMAYLSKHADARRDPASVLTTVRSVVMTALTYDATVSSSPDHGRIARYALGEDYHDVLRRMLDGLLAWIQEQVPGTLGRGVVDTAPLLERDFARRAGLGWFGKNTMLLNRKLGSWFFLGALLLDLDLPADAPFVADHCGTCTACLDACPTQAFPAAHVLDARRCISYLTIELRTGIPEDLRPAVGDWIFGCDVCQEVCPWNRAAARGLAFPSRSASAKPQAALVELLDVSDDEFRGRYRHTALWRAKRRGLLRNVAIALGNVGDVRALPALERALSDSEPLVREAAAWAIGRIRERTAVRSEPET